MSVEALRWAKQQKPRNATQRAVLMAIADYANKSGKGWPSQATLAADMLLTDRTIRTALKCLEADCFLMRTFQRRGDGTRGVDRIQLCLTDELREQAAELVKRKSLPVAEPPENGSKTTGKSFRNHRKLVPPPPEGVSGQELPLRELPVGNHHKLNSSEATASGVPAIAVPPVEMSIESRLWFEGRASLMETGMPHKQAGSMIGRWISRYGDHARILEAIRQACASGTQDAIPFIVAILGGSEGRPRASPSRGRRSGMVGIALNDYGRELQ